MKTIIKEASKGNFNIRLTSSLVKWANGTEFVEYTLTRLHKTRVQSSGDVVKSYKRKETALKNFDLMAG